MLHTYGDGEVTVTVTVRFIAAKVKVAPAKATSVPRLEPVTVVLGLEGKDRAVRDSLRELYAIHLLRCAQ